MGARKIQNENEVIRWFEAGVTYSEMIERYRDKYNIETTRSMWSNIRGRLGLDRRIARDDSLIPWTVKLEHRHLYPITMLRREARRRSGFDLSEEDERALDAWIAGLKEDGVVLHYDPDTEEGWFYVPMRPGIDVDLIRVPDPIIGH